MSKYIFLKRALILLMFVFFVFPFSMEAVISFPNKIDTLQEKINVQKVLNTTLTPSPNLKVDGVLGKQSIKTVKVFQKVQGLTPDGKIGPMTRAVLEKVQTRNIAVSEDSSSPQVNPTLPTPGCSLGALFNILTGQKCSPSTPSVTSGGGAGSPTTPVCTNGTCTTPTSTPTTPTTSPTTPVTSPTTPTPTTPVVTSPSTPVTSPTTPALPAPSSTYTQSGEYGWWGPKNFNIYRLGLLYSENFETDIIGQHPTNYLFDATPIETYVKTTEDTVSNSKAMEISCGLRQSTIVSQNYAASAVKLEPGGAYQLSVKMRADHNDYPFIAGFDTSIAAGTHMYDGTNIATTQNRITTGKQPFMIDRNWKEYTFNFVFPRSGEANFGSTWQYLYSYFECDRNYSYTNKNLGKVYIDDVNIYKITNNNNTNIAEHQNIIKNSDFEMGKTKVVPAGFFHDGTRTTALPGETNFTPNKYIYYAGGDVNIGTTDFLGKLGPFSLPDLPATYTFSAYVRCSPKDGSTTVNPTADCHTNIRVLGSSSGTAIGSIEEKTISTSWERISIPVTLRENPQSSSTMWRNQFYIMFMKYGNTEWKLDIDNIQFEKGSLSAYKPAPIIDASITTDAYANLFYVGEPLKVNIALQNNKGTAFSGTYGLTAVDFQGNVVHKETKSVSLAVGETKILTTTIGTNNKGIFPVELLLKNSSGNIVAEYATTVGRIEKASNYAYEATKDNDFLGIDLRALGLLYPYDGDSIALDRWKIADNLGIRWVREFVTPDGLEIAGVNNIRPEPIIEQAVAKGYKVLATIDPYTSCDASTIDQYKNYSSRLTAKYGSMIDAYEPWNEPWLQCEIDPLRVAIPAIAQGLRQGDPTATIISNVGDGSDGYGNPYVDKSHTTRTNLESYSELFANMDFISVHNYPYENLKVDNHVPKVYAGYKTGLPTGYKDLGIWQTEAAFGANDIMDHDTMLHYTGYIYGGRVWESDAEMAVGQIKQLWLEKNAGLKKSFLFVMSGYYPWRFANEMFKNTWESPKSIYPALSSMVRMVDNTEFLRTRSIDINSNTLFMHSYKKGSRYLITYWMEDDDFVDKYTLNIPTSSGTWRASDFMGNDIPVVMNGSNRVLKANVYPSYLVFEGSLADFNNAIDSATVLTNGVNTISCSGSATQSCTVTNGTGSQSRTCNSGTWSAYGACSVSSCNVGYEISGNSCVVTAVQTCSGSATQSCTVTNGTGSQSRTCTSGTWSAYGTCGVVSCNAGYQVSGNICAATVVPTCTGSATQSCTVTNGTGSQSRTCNSGTWSAYGACSVSSCNTGYQVSGNSCVVTVTPDTTKPAITSFTIPSSSSSVIIPISTFTASDNVGVTGYLLTETSTIPSPNSSSWVSSAPTTYTFPSEGSKTLYAWAKDVAGNVSNSLNATIVVAVTVTPPPVVQGSAIIIDHTSTDISKIPSCWIEKAKTLTMQYAHRSHGNNIFEGMAYLSNIQSNLKYNRAVNTLPAQTNPIGIRIMDGNPPLNTYSTPDLFWNTASGLTATENNWKTGLYNISMWAWSSEFGSNLSVSVIETGIQTYLNSMNNLAAKYPNVRFVYMTGPVNNTNANLVGYNQEIRNYAKTNNKILYDMEDIGKYDPSGVYYPNANGNCSWCASWCTNHPADCVNLPTTDVGCSHTHGLLCVQTGKAYWWMMARLAGWDGSPSSSCSGVLGVSSYNFTLNLKYGSTGNEVTELQKILVKDGYLTATPNGNFGPATEKALKEYQKTNGLNSDGTVGPATRKVLNK